jgi:hypothetical protein
LFVLYFVSRVSAVLEVAALYYDPLGFTLARHRKSDHFVSYGHKLAHADCFPYQSMQRQLEKRFAAQFRDADRFVNQSGRGSRCDFSPGVSHSLIVDLVKARRDIGLALRGFPQCPMKLA